MKLKTFLALATAVATAAGPIAAVPRRAVAAAPTTAPATQPNQPLAESLAARYAKLDRSLRELPRDRFDPGAVAEVVGRDADALAGWVRDHTDALPYRGALKGAAGVLMDRGGNALDRALLLAEMLQQSGYDVRLANATLPADQARAVLATIAANGRKNAMAARGAGGKPEADRPEDAKLRQRSRERARKHADDLFKLIGNPPAADEAADRARLAAVADHWWVQRQQGGQWVDVDVTGVKPPAAARTVAVGPASDKLPLDAKDCHEVELRVVIEAFRGGKLVTEPVVKHTFRPAEAVGRSVSVVHLPGDRPKPAEKAGGTEADANKQLRAALAKQEVFLPAIMVDGKAILEASFTTAGEVDRNPKMDPAGKLAAGAGKGMGGLGGALSGDAPAAAGVLTAEWIEYEIRVPGEPPQTVRRPVFDLVGPAARAAGVARAPKLGDADVLRRALLLSGSTSVLLQPASLPPEFVAARMAKGSLREKPVMLAVARGEIRTPAQYAEAMSKLPPTDPVAPAVAMIRDGLDLSDGRTFIDRPNVVHHRAWLEDDAAGTVVDRHGIDLAVLSTAAVAPGPDAFAARVGRGVADTLAEFQALGEKSAATENTIGVMELAAKAGAAPTVVRPGDAAGLAKLNLPADAHARAAADLAAGHVLVLASGQPGRWTWWRVDAATGQTVGVMDNGYHVSMLERLTLELNSLQATLGVALTPAALKAATYQQMWQWSGKQGFLFIDLWEIQAECIVALQVVSRFRG